MTDESARDRLIVALDCDGREALELAQSLKGHVQWLKVGMTLFYEQGPEIVRRISAMGFDVFLDLKLHDIPHQAEGAARAVAQLGVAMLTVHASGGSAMIEAAVRGARAGALDAGQTPPRILAVTVLTSLDDAALAAIGVARSSAEQVPLLGRVARAGGADGVVCSPLETAAMRAVLGESALIATPGVRPSWAEKGDQSRVSTPVSALRAGASHLVVGRPITTAPVPADAADRIIAEMGEAYS